VRVTVEYPTVVSLDICVYDAILLFVAVFTDETLQVFVVVVHAFHVGPGQVEVRVCVMEPICPVGQAIVCVCGEGGAQEVTMAVCTEQEVFEYVPESVPFVHIRCCD